MLLASCSAVLGYESDYTLGAGGAAGNASAGQSGVGGNAGAAGEGAAGSGGTAGTAGSPGGSGGAGGRAGAGGTTAGVGGASGTGAFGGGNAGTSAGAAGSVSGGAAGSVNGGAAGSVNGGAAGSVTAGAGGTAGGAAGAGGGKNPTDCSVIYVSPQGADGNDGCSPAKPKRRPVDALAATMTTTKELRFCDGNYQAESFELTKAISLRGSYDCTTWDRPAFSSSSVRSTITAAAGAKAALVVSGITVTRAVEIEGLTLAGGSGEGTSRGIWLTKGAAPTIRDCALVGGKSTGGSLGSVGAYIDQGGAPRLERDLVRGGEGDTTGDAVASVGLYLVSDAGLVDVVENRVEGGRGTVHGKGLPTAALYAEPLLFGLVGDHALVNNVFVGGEGNDASESRFLLSAALFFEPGSAVDSTSLTVRGGLIEGGRGTVGTGSDSSRMVAAVGVSSQRHGTLRFEGVRAYGGDCPASDGLVAPFLVSAGRTRIVASLVHAGGARSATKLARLFNLNGQNGTPDIEILGSTLLTGQQSGGAATVYSYGTAKLVMRSNYVVQQTAYAPVVQLDAACGLAAGSVFEANAFAFTRAGDPLLQQNQSDCQKNLVSTTAFNAELSGSSGNVRVTPTNGVSPDLTVACGGGASCLDKLFVGFDAATSGLSQVLSATDADLSPRLPALCALATGGKRFAESPTDLLGKTRPGTRTSMGAFQVGEGLCP